MRHKGIRSLSHTEIASALTCEAQHAFGYTGQLTGGIALKRRQATPILSDGRAWGAAVAAWHAYSRDRLDSTTEGARAAAHEALRASYAEDVAGQVARGFAIEEDQAFREQRLTAMLDHYIAIATPFPNLTRLEGWFETPIPSRTGRRSSNRYRFGGRIDGYTAIDNRQYIVEFKLRSSLMLPEHVRLSRQIRRYAWALARAQGVDPYGVIVDERLNELPKQARIVHAKRKGEGVDGKTVSHAVDQVTTPERYLQACRWYGVEPNPETLEALRARVWQVRHDPIVFRPDELEEAGRELVSAAELIRDLDTGRRYPIRNTQPSICGRCDFKAICPNPDDRSAMADFAQRPPKGLRP